MSAVAILDHTGDSSLEKEPMILKPGETIQQILISPELDSYQT